MVTTARRSGQTLDDKAERRIRAAQTVRVLLVGAVVAVVALFLIDNRDQATVGWTVSETDAPLYVFLLGAFALGILTGVLLSYRHRHRHR